VANDQDLVANALAAPRAFESLFARTGAASSTYGLHRLGHRRDAEDAVIQVFANVYAGLRTAMGVGEARPIEREAADV
jgi:DNA-directed RNA polymerase specialized sigma24 family protein